MPSTGQRISDFLAELQEELAAKDHEIAALRTRLAEQSGQIPAGLRQLIQQQEVQIEHARLILRAIENAPFDPQPPPSGDREQLEELQAALDADRATLQFDLAQFEEERNTVRASRNEKQEVLQVLESERAAHREHIARLINELESARESASPKTCFEDLHRELEMEKARHQAEVAALHVELEAAKESGSVLEAGLIEQRGAFQRIEAKFSLYAAAVSKLAVMPEPKRPKLLQSAKQLPQRNPQASAQSIR